MNLGWWLSVGYIALAGCFLLFVVQPVNEQLALDAAMWVGLSLFVVIPLLVRWAEKREDRAGR